MTVTIPRRIIAIGSVVAFALAIVEVAGVTVVHAQDYTGLLAAPDRTEADRQNDTRRDALKLLTFTGPKTGWLVLDMGAGAGYSTELMSRAVGPTGKVWGQNDKPVEKFEIWLKTPAMINALSQIRPTTVRRSIYRR